jgi:hypothetical protein
MPDSQAREEMRRWAAGLQQAERAYWDTVSRYVVLTTENAGEPKKRPSRVFDVAAVREFEAAELARRKAADDFHAMLKRRARAMEE